MLIGNYKTSYRADEAIFNNWPKKLGFILVLIYLAFLPMFSSDYVLLMAGQIGIYIIAVTGLNVLIGYTGLVSLGHGAFFAIGAYSTVALHHVWPTLFPLIVVGLSMLAAAVGGFIFGLPSLRVKGLYLAVATLSANFIVLFLIKREWLEEWTGGVAGIQTPNATVFGYELSTLQDKYYLIIPIMVLLILFSQNLFRTKFGRALIAIRDKDYSAEILGISLFSYKLKSFAISAAYCGAAGSLWAYFYPAILPENFALNLSIMLVACLVAGGLGRTLGPVFGVFLILLAPEILKVVASSITGGEAAAQRYFSPARDVIFGLIIILFLIFEPMGMVSMWDRFWRFLERWPFAK